MQINQKVSVCTDYLLLIIVGKSLHFGVQLNSLNDELDFYVCELLFVLHL